MAIKCTVPYRGVTIPGAMFAVKSAYWKQVAKTNTAPEVSFLVYEVKVLMPDGSEISVPEWQNVKADVGTGTPLGQAEAHMRARLTAGGATNITEV
mgnify:CR=1 FL=1